MTGYVGVELARLLYKHPLVELVSVTGRSAAGKKLSTVFPHLAQIDLTITSELESTVDVAFSAMAHKASAEAIIPLLKKDIRVIDLSADFRLKEAAKYQEWYGFEHPAPELLKKSVFGLPEIYRESIRAADIVANPGCYPTSAILSLAPLVKYEMINPDIIIDSKSGVSGAGRTLALPMHFSEASDNVRAYGLGGHRHLPEIVQELEALKPGSHILVTFVPHIVPMARGILSTCYASLKGRGLHSATDELIRVYEEFYRDEPFTKIVREPPETKYTWGSNLCFIYPTLDHRTGKAVIISCIDNLVKGAAGQAVQNMNIMFGFPETAGLEAIPLYP